MKKLLELTNIHKRYQMGENIIGALNGISLSIYEGDFIAIMGPSGSGKSTLMHIIGLLDVPDEGSYHIEGEEIANFSDNDLAILRRKMIGFIFQQFNLLPRMTALENVSLPLLYSQKKMDLEWAKQLLEQVGLSSRLNHGPNELSGGQQQRAAIARSLVNRPRIILADEPTGNLDSTSEKEIMSLLKELNQQGITVVIVTHEESIGKQANRLIRMRDGVIICDETHGPTSSSTSTNTTPINVNINVTPEAESSAAKSSFLAIEYFFQHLKQAIKTLNSNKIRTVLSMLGIMIGVAAVVAMLALGRGAQTAIENQLTSLGSNLLVVRAGAVRGADRVRSAAGSSAKLTIEDSTIIKAAVPNIGEVAPNVSGRVQLTSLNKNWNTSVTGTIPAYTKIRAATPIVGRFFTEEENKKRSRVAIIGTTIVRELFDGKNPIGENFKLNKINFQVIGVLPEKGATGFHDQDDVVVIPLLTAMYRVLGKVYVDNIDVVMSDPNQADTIQENILELLFTQHKVPPSQQDNAFQIRNMADIQAALSESTRAMTLLLAAIAAISLLVGGIGIMNIMLVSVTERTREIGLRKAVGAKRSDILLQFLIESVVVSLIGGTLGIFLAWLITILLAAIAGWITTISVASVILACLFSASIGIIFGLYPARKASLLAPIDALRYE